MPPKWICASIVTFALSTQQALALTITLVRVVSPQTGLWVSQNGTMTHAADVPQGTRLQVNEISKEGWRQVVIRLNGATPRWGWVAEKDIQAEAPEEPLPPSPTPVPEPVARATPVANPTPSATVAPPVVAVSPSPGPAPAATPSSSPLQAEERLVAKREHSKQDIIQIAAKGGYGITTLGLSSGNLGAELSARIASRFYTGVLVNHRLLTSTYLLGFTLSSNFTEIKGFLSIRSIAGTGLYLAGDLGMVFSGIFLSDGLNTLTVNGNGFGFGFRTGWEARLGRHFSLGPEVEFYGIPSLYYPDALLSVVVYGFRFLGVLRLHF